MGLQAGLIETICVGNVLGECVLWRDSDQSVWWTDVQSCRLYRLAWPSLALTVYETPERLCSFSFLSGTDQEILAAFASGIAIYAPDKNHVRWLHQPQELGGSLRLNDGRTDPKGRFWVGSMSEDLVPSGRLYRTGKDGILDIKKEGIRISNGLCWAPDGRTMYFTDSPTRQILKCPYDADTGTLGDWQVFTTVADGEPDGAITDAAGTHWFAHWGEGRVVATDPTGTRTHALQVPTHNPTCPALGGPAGNLMFVTSAKQGTTPSDAQAGHLFIFETNLCAGPTARAQVGKMTLARIPGAPQR